MRWKGGRRSENVEDRRGMGGGPRMAMGGGLLSLILVIGALLLGVNPQLVMQFMAAQPGAQPQAPVERSAEENEAAEFVRVVLGYTEDAWAEIFREQLGKQYRPPKLVLFTDAVRSACGSQSSAVGPFYCPADEKVYIDLVFFSELKQKFGAPGDFAQAYVIAHEVGHHVQNLLGISDAVSAQQQRMNKVDANALSVRLELQADCLAGIWARHSHEANNILERGDVEEALNAANAIGDDTLQRRSRGRVVPESFTHGTSEQRVRWFREGLESGDVDVALEVLKTRDL